MLKALKVEEMRYFGTIYGSYILDCCCIGKAKLEGIKEEVFITWGRKITPKDVKEFTTQTHSKYPQLVYYPVLKGKRKCKGYEMIIPNAIIRTIFPAIAIFIREEDKHKVSSRDELKNKKFMNHFLGNVNKEIEDA